MRFILHFFLFNFFFINLTGQSSGLRFISLSTEDGLSNNTVTCILQDSQGFMWFGTEDGLNRYDGYSFTIYRHSPIEANGLINNNISCLIQDKNGIIWIGTKGGGLNRYDPRTDPFSFFLHDPDDSSSLCNNEILSMYEDRSGQLWIGTDGGGISRYDRENDRFFNYGSSYQVASTLSCNEILSIGEDNLGNMWYGTTRSLEKHVKVGSYHFCGMGPGNRATVRLPPVECKPLLRLPGHPLRNHACRAWVPGCTDPTRFRPPGKN